MVSSLKAPTRTTSPPSESAVPTATAQPKCVPSVSSDAVRMASSIHSLPSKRYTYAEVVPFGLQPYQRLHRGAPTAAILSTIETEEPK